MNTRCQYCGKEIAEGEDFCSESCASAYRTATGTKLSDLKWLLIGIAVSLFVILWGPITRNEQMVGVGVLIVGIALIFCPFATPNMIQIFGYQRARFVVRLVGAVALVFGAYIGWFAA